MKKQMAVIFVVVMLLALVAIPASAMAFPNPGVGTTYTDLANKEASPASAVIQYYNTSGGTIAGPNPTIPGNGSITIDPDSTQLPQNFVGSAVVSSNKRLASTVNTEWEGGIGDGFEMGLYSGVAAGASEICFPSLWKFDNIISSFAVQNTGSNPVVVDLTYTSRAGVTNSTGEDTILPGAQHTFNLETVPNIPLGWDGSAKVVVRGQGSVAGVAVVSYAGRSATYNAADCSGLSGSTVLVVPTHYRLKPNGTDYIIYSAVNIQNLSGSPANAKLTYVDRGGDVTLPDLVIETTIPANSTRGVNTRNGGDLQGSDYPFDPLDADVMWDGAVLVEVDQPAVATVITQWDRGGNKESGFYAAANSSSGATKIFAPGVRRIKPGDWQEYSAVIVQNLGTGTADFTIEFYDGAGNNLLTYANESVGPGGALGYNTRNGANYKPPADYEALGDNYAGHAVVTSNNGQPLAVVLNGVSRAPDGGSATTNGVTD